MIQNLYAYRNNESGLFSLPFNVRCERDQICEYFKEGLLSAPLITLKSMVNDDLYCVGSYDTLTGVIVPCNEFLLHLGTIAKDIIQVKEGDENGKREE